MGTVITISDASARLSRSEETALNILLERHGGSIHGKQWYKLTWAADDNVGLVKRHGLGCSKVDPHDWICSCPVDPSVRAPVCYDANQACYHLLAWSPPQTGSSQFSKELGEDLSQGSYECTGLHFVDPESSAPISPRATIIEEILPRLELFAQAVKAAAYGADAILQQERQKKIDGIRERERQADKKQTEHFKNVLEDAMPAFGGAPFTGAGRKRQISADRAASDIKRSKPAIHSENFTGPTLRSNPRKG